MFHFYIGSQLSWDKYLKNTSVFKGIRGDIRRGSKREQVAISEQAQEIIASREVLAKKFAAGFDSMNITVESGFGRLENIINGVGASIDAMRASFDYNMALLIEQFQLQNQTMLNFLQQMEAVHSTLENPTLTQAREYYRIGCDRLAKGLLDKALEAFKESAAKDDANFLTQLMIGKLYLYGVNDECNVLDLQKAEQHLRAAARYAKAEAQLLPEASRYAGEALLHASISCYAQANEKVLEGKTTEAQQLLQTSFDLAKEATTNHPELSEGFYHQAKFAALLGDGKSATASLQRAIELDEAYCLKADTDFDFRFVLSDVKQLFRGLRNNSAEDVHKKLHQAEALLTDWLYPSLEARNAEAEIRRLLNEAQGFLARNTYFDIREASNLLQQAEQTFKTLLVHKSVHHSIAAHSSRVTSLAFSSDQAMLASGGGDGVIHLWRLPENQLMFTLQGHRDTITQLAFSHNGRMLASVDRKGCVKLWHVGSGVLVCDLMEVATPVHCVSFSPDDTKLAVGGYDRQATLWAAVDGALIHTLNGHKSSVDTVVFSSDSKLLATGSPDNTAMLWEVETGKLLHTFFGCSGLANCLAFCYNDTQLICGSSDGGVRFYSVQDGKMLYTLPERSGTVSWMALSPNSNLLATVHYGKAIQIWDVPNNKLLHNLKPFSPGITSVRFSPDGIILAASDFLDRSVKLWNVQDGKLVHVLAGNLTCAEFSHDGATLVTGDETGTLKFWGRMAITRAAFEASQKRRSITAGTTTTTGIKSAPAPRATPRPTSGNSTPGWTPKAPSSAAAPAMVKPKAQDQNSERGDYSSTGRPQENIYPTTETTQSRSESSQQQTTQSRSESSQQQTTQSRSESSQQQTTQRSTDPDQTAMAQASEKLAGEVPVIRMDSDPYRLELERLLEKQQRQAAKLEKMGRCLECGKKLGFFAKLWGLKFCREHGF